MSESTPVTLHESYRHACLVTRQSGSSFRLSFLLLPRSQYRAMCVLYAFMRLTDDLADARLPPDAADNFRETALRQWREQLQACLTAERDTHPLHPALRAVVREYSLDPRWLEDVITGVEYDLHPRLLPSYEELRHYCYLVAGTVGLCCQALWRADISRTRELAITCGEAFQLTNILRDLREDALQNRCYLPLDELARFHCTPETFRLADASPNVLALLEFQIERARQAYQTALQLDSCLTGPGRRMFRVMFRTYACLLEKIARNPAESLFRRAKLSRRQQLAILLTAPHQQPRIFPACVVPGK